MTAVTLLLDYRKAFYSADSNMKTHHSMNTDLLVDRFAQLGIHAKLLPYSKVDLSENWNSKLVLYQSAEDPGLQFRSYIEDVVLALSLSGARLIPPFPFLRAHSNKTFLAMLCQSLKARHATTLWVKTCGVMEDFDPLAIQYPAVFKLASGAGGTSVCLLENPQHARSVVRHLTRSSPRSEAIKERLKLKFRKGYVPYSSHRKKFIIQQFLPGLECDYKVLIYGDRYYVLRRCVRDSDFRASGSGRFSWPKEVPGGLLDWAEQLFREFDVSHASFDIALANSDVHLLEAQFVTFGSLTLERSCFFWRRVESNWKRVEQPSELEETFAAGVAYYLKRKGWIGVT